MSTDGPHDLEPIEPRAAQELYLDHEANQCSDVTVKSHEYRTKTKLVSTEKRAPTPTGVRIRALRVAR